MAKDTVSPVQGSRGATEKDSYGWLVREYGLVLPLSLVAKLMGFRTAATARRAYLRGGLPFPLRKLPNRRNLFATTADVASWLDSLKAESQEQLLDQLKVDLAPRGNSP